LFAAIVDAKVTGRSSGFRLALTKKESNTWTSLQKSTTKPNVPKPKPETAAGTGEDPSGNLMSMMKDLYEQGDDDMKRTINEAWAKAQNEKK
jgi:calcyclin binding protein